MWPQDIHPNCKQDLNIHVSKSVFRNIIICTSILLYVLQSQPKSQYKHSLCWYRQTCLINLSENGFFSTTQFQLNFYFQTLKYLILNVSGSFVLVENNIKCTRKFLKISSSPFLLDFLKCEKKLNFYWSVWISPHEMECPEYRTSWIWHLTFL